ncbi:MAG TPA: bifunctional 5,10-methylenetetrahydrofolate dehydrogenase/5,10-methenyltetrahydrofolate cyclohydrolase [Patescibacteria group bacterium]|nr:bifunctional 5,10-methylenetetrahydrofolate dehydrogenase/5,10-methenyltetrahydrofolate cyclohydrolase [Patescibacteria group bacterium]
MQMGKIIDGKKIAANILKEVAEEIKNRKLKITLAVVLVGEHTPSLTYVRKKAEAAKKVGINFQLHHLPANISKKILVQKIHNIQKDNHLGGLIVQLPLPEPLYTTEVLNAINPKFDVDCLTDTNLGKLVMKTGLILPPTPGAVKAILKILNIKLKGKRVVIIGAGALVGKPLAIILLNKEATVTVANRYTKNLKEICRQADIIVTAVGKKNLLTADLVKRGVVVIDTGICFVRGKMYGDVDFPSVSKKARYITPVPGGVGPITVSLLLKNTLKLTKHRLGLI